MDKIQIPKVVLYNERPDIYYIRQILYSLMSKLLTLCNDKFAAKIIGDY